MARFYASFDNSTKSALESNFYERKTYTNGSTLKTALVNARLALSAGFYAAIEPVNRNGSLGITVPAGTFTADGTNISFTNLYTSTAANRDARWPADPSLRPTEQITASNATPVTPTDGGSFTQSLYTDAQTALGDALAGIADGGPNGRLGQNAWRTLASLWHDHDLTYFAWDDFSPGTPTGLTPTQPASQSRTLPLALTLPWNWQFQADRAGNAIVFARVDRTDGGGSQFYVAANNVSTAASTGSYTATIPGSSLPAGTYELTYRLRFQDPTITTHFGDIAEYISGPNFITLTA